MQRVITVAIAFLPFAVSTDMVKKAEVTPVEQVINLLNGMLTQGRAEKEAETAQYTTYKTFCDDTSAAKTTAISDAALEIETLQADIQAAEANAMQLSAEISEDQADVATWEADQKAATQVRSTENDDYTALHKDYSESIDALGRAIQTLQAESYNRPQAEESLAQVSKLHLVPTKARRSLELFLAQVSQSPEEHGYEFQSGHVIDMLEELLTKFRDEKTSIETQETNAKHAYDALMQDLTGEIDGANSDIQSKTESRASELQTKAEKEGTLADTQATKAEDEQYLSELNATCEKKAADFETRSKLRDEEIATIEKAVEILSGSEVAGSAAKHLPAAALLSTRRAALVALRASLVSRTDQERVHDYLARQAQRLNSRVLADLAAHLSKDDHFAKVRQMIQDLIVRLMEEANAEASHKQWCDAELASNEKTRTEKTEAVNALHAEIDALEASSAQLAAEIAELTAQISDLGSAMANATALRQNESAINKETINDARVAQEAVAKAMLVLSKFYSEAAQSTAFVQQQPVAPEIFESPYVGMQAENGGVMGLLEVIQSDFARLEAETTAAEAAAAKEYDTFMSTSKADKAAKQTEMEHKTLAKQNDDQALVVANNDLEGTQKELDAALEYYEKLKPACVDASTSYDERVARREEEIASLQEALRILSGEEAPGA